MELVYPFRVEQWVFPSSRVCPHRQCQIGPRKRGQHLIACPPCQKLLRHWVEWLSIALHLSDQPPPLRYAYLNISLPGLIDTFSTKTLTLISHTPPKEQQKETARNQQNTLKIAKPVQNVLQPKDSIPAESPNKASKNEQKPSPTPVRQVLPPTPITQSNRAPKDEQKPPPVVQPAQPPLTISRYISKQRERMNQDTATLKQQQQAAQTEVAIDRSHKYLWMQSAWTMTEALRHNTDGAPLQVPENHVYIELEQPHQLQGWDVAAFSFLRLQEHCWALSLIDPTGQTVWKALYEKREWKLPQGYICPQQECQVEERNGVVAYLLCPACQDRVHSSTSWITTALRMIHGDFQEVVEVKEPEYVVETISKRVYDHETKKAKDVKVRHRYRVIRYFDASILTNKQPHSKRGSWMDGRPVAQDANEMNPEAIIYVRIQPKEHDRTYRHQRYTNVRGKTQHIEPPPRLQPMTIATFRQLPRVQHVTRVLASKFEI